MSYFIHHSLFGRKKIIIFGFLLFSDITWRWIHLNGHRYLVSISIYDLSHYIYVIWNWHCFNAVSFSTSIIFCCVVCYDYLKKHQNTIFRGWKTLTQSFSVILSLFPKLVNNWNIVLTQQTIFFQRKKLKSKFPIYIKWFPKGHPRRPICVCVCVFF